MSVAAASFAHLDYIKLAFLCPLIENNVNLYEKFYH